MKRSQLLAVASIAALSVPCVRATDYDFNVSNGQWNDGNSWDPVGIPAAGDTVTIGAGEYCYISGTDQEIDSITVNFGGILDIYNDGTLTIYPSGSSTVNGLVALGDGAADSAIILIDDDIQFAGTGIFSAEKNVSYGGAKFTWASSPGVAIEISSTLSIRGSVLFDGISIDNDGLLIVDHAYDTMQFGVGGTFSTLLSGGTGTVSVSAGSATFPNADGDAGAAWTLQVTAGLIEIGSASDFNNSLCAVDVSGGLFDVNSDFTGKRMEFSGGTIDVSAGKTLVCDE